jgi:hypothetical protein
MCYLKISRRLGKQERTFIPGSVLSSWLRSLFSRSCPTPLRLRLTAPSPLINISQFRAPRQTTHFLDPDLAAQHSEEEALARFQYTLSVKDESSWSFGNTKLKLRAGGLEEKLYWSAGARIRLPRNLQLYWCGTWGRSIGLAAENMKLLVGHSLRFQRCIHPCYVVCNPSIWNSSRHDLRWGYE